MKNMTFNVRPLRDRSVVDPKKVTRAALQNAASIAGLFADDRVPVTEIPAKE
jgi:chaperonin GroEL (HSP60 family)